MNTSWFIAERYIRAHRRNGFLSFITTIAILGIMLGTGALIITLSILDGFEREIKDKVISFTSHIEVRGFQNKSLSDHEKSIAEVKKKITGVKSISPYAMREGMIRSGGGVDGILLKGIDKNSDALGISHTIVEGSFLRDEVNDTAQLVIGRKLANRLDVNLGDKVVLFILPPEERSGLMPRAMRFTVAGIYESGMSEFDDIYAYTDLASAQRLFQMGDDISGYDLLVSDITRIDSVAAQISSLLGYPHYVRTVFQLYRNLFSWVELQKKLSPILMSLIILVATVNIVGTLLMFVLEKTRAIGILKSLGASPPMIQRIFIIQGIIMALLGIGLGNLLAYILCWLQLAYKIISLPSDIYYMNTVPIILNYQNFILVSVIAFILCILTTVLPARAAGKIKPVSALKFGS